MTVAGSRVKHLPGVRVIPRKRKLMWAWGAVLGVLTFAMVVGGMGVGAERHVMTIQTWIQKW